MKKKNKCLNCVWLIKAGDRALCSFASCVKEKRSTVLKKEKEEESERNVK